ncbi:MAG: beta-phosphoglucomutase [Sphaerochaeta sp.]|nr:beta-phosphoglucomutase [Sphaerochaeta sp.]
MDTMSFGYAEYDPSQTPHNETLFTLANGYLGLRGDFEEAEGSYHKGTYINGFYDSEPIIYGESAYGFAENHETILNLPDPKRIELEVGDLPFSMKRGVVHASSRILNYRTGILTRTIDWSSAHGDRVRITTERLVSFVEKYCALVTYTVEAVDKALSIKLTSYLDIGVRNRSSKDDPRVGAKFTSNPLLIDHFSIEEESLNFSARTRNSGLTLYGSAFHTTTKEALETLASERDLALSYTFDLAKGEAVTLNKFIAYTTEDDSAPFRAKRSAQEGFASYARQQQEFLSEFWQVGRILIEGDKSSEQALQFNIFHLLQSCGRDGKTSMAAKGLTGEGYEGHYFWDTEAYALPMFCYLKPDIAKSLLDYRYKILPKARLRAETMSLEGALFPWRTISGEECSAYYPAGTAQYHIDADILYAVEKYLAATGEEAPQTYVEMAIESARMWLSLGSFIDGQFCINEVTGPDEYTACVNNNTYTNLMAQNNLRFSIALVEQYLAKDTMLPLSVGQDELDSWEKAQEAMKIPFDEKAGIYAQDDSFLSKADWPFATTAKEKHPLLLHFHPLVIYRHRVLKQPDLVLAQFFLSGLFTKAERIRNFMFYEPYTTGDSSLSHCIQSIMASDSFQPGKAWSYFTKTVRLDIDDIQGNTEDGIHTASMAGSWMATVYGFAGFRDWKGTFSFDPKLPDAWQSLTFSLMLHNSLLKVAISSEEVTYSLMTGTGLNLVHRNESFTLNKDESRTFSLRPKLGGVLFDLDGVLCDTAHLHYKAWKQVSDGNLLAFDREVNKGLLGVSREASLQVILDHNETTWPQERRDEVLKRKNDAYVASLESITPSNLLPGVLSLLDELRSEGIKIALASASRNARSVCEKLGILDRFDAIADISDVQMPKPEADIFLAASEQIEVWYTNCVGVEDAKAGIEAIKRAGMKAVGIGSESDLPGSDLVVKETKELSIAVLRQVVQGL